MPCSTLIPTMEPGRISAQISIFIPLHGLLFRNARDNKFNNNGMKVLGVPPRSPYTSWSPKILSGARRSERAKESKCAEGTADIAQQKRSALV